MDNSDDFVPVEVVDNSVDSVTVVDQAEEDLGLKVQIVEKPELPPKPESLSPVQSPPVLHTTAE